MRYFFTLLFSIICLSSFAQSHNLKGEVLDQEGSALPFATVVLLNPSDSTFEYFGITTESGQWEIKDIKPGEYLMQIAFLGFETFYRNQTIPNEGGINVGTLILRPKPVDLQGVQVIGEHIPIMFKNDTIEFNSKAFKTTPDAVVEDLLKKLPGFQVDRAGNIKAMGEDIRKVLVDGKEFFGNDPKLATKNLPAEAIDKVQVFDRRSEEAEFSGVDDGSREKAVNLVLKEDSKKGVFGHLLAGYGTDNHYQGSGKAYRFTDKSQMAALAMQNNINQFGFSFQDYMDFNGGMASFVGGGGGTMAIAMDGSMPINFGEPVSGLTTSGAGGLNLSYSPEKERRFFASYVANGSNKSLIQNTQTQNFVSDGSFFQEEDQNQTTRDTAHRVNLGVRYRIDSTQNIVLDGGGSLSNTNNWGQTMTNTLSEDLLINWLNRDNNSATGRLNGNIKGSWMKKFNSGNSIAKIGANANYSKNKSRTDWQNESFFAGDENPTNTGLFQNLTTENLSYSGDISITQKLGKKYFVVPEFKIGSSQDGLIKAQGIPYPSDAIIDSLSPNFTRNYEWLKPELTIKRSSDKLQLNLFLRSELNRTSNSLWEDDPVTYEGFYILPGASVDYEYSTGHRLNIMYQSSVNQPSTNQLLPVADRNNPLSVYYGNRNLLPERQQNLFVHWMIFDAFSSTSFFSGLNASYTKDKINWSREIGEQLGQTLTLVNVEDDFNVGGSMDFTTPIRKLGINFNTRLQENWNKGINLVNGDSNTNTNMSHSLSMRLDNRKKKQWDIMVGGSAQITDAKYSLQSSLNNRYMDFSYYADVRFFPNDSWNFHMMADVTNYNDKSFGESINIPLISAEISWFFLENKRASFSLQGADLLNKNTGISRVSELNYLRETRSNIIGRYVMLSFKYRLNKFGSNKGGIEIKMHK